MGTKNEDRMGTEISHASVLDVENSRCREERGMNLFELGMSLVIIGIILLVNGLLIVLIVG